MKRALCMLLCCCVLLSGCYTESGGVETEPPESVESLPETQPRQTEPEATLPPETEPTMPAIAKTGTATILVAGDIMSHMPVVNAGRQGSGYNYDSFFASVAPLVGEADLALANLETTFAGTSNGNRYSGFPRFNCPDAMADALKNAGFDMILTANNHSYDTGVYGFNRTQQVLQDRGLTFLGTTAAAEDPSYTVTELDGIKVGLICYTYGQIDEATGQKSVNGLPMDMQLKDRINVFDYEKLDLFYDQVRTHLSAMEADGAQATVLFIHWGNEYRTKESQYQQQMAQNLCDLGVDVIVGGHPHVVQGVELLAGTEDPSHRTLCIYSVGNAVSNQRVANVDLKTGHTEDGVLFQFTLCAYSDGSVRLDAVEALPIWLWKGYRDGRAAYEIVPLQMENDQWVQTPDLGSGDLAKARDSYLRSAEILDPGMKTVETWLSQCAEEMRQEYRIYEQGVG